MSSVEKLDIEVSKRVIDNFLIVWDNLSDTGPCDWQDNIELNGNQSDEVDNIFTFIGKLRKYRGDECLHCGSGKEFCGCDKV